MGLSKPLHALQRGAEVSDIVDMVAVAVVEAQEVPDSRKKAEARLMKRMLAPNSRDHLKSPVPETIEDPAAKAAVDSEPETLPRVPEVSLLSLGQ
jgi:hypothetical protein